MRVVTHSNYSTHGAWLKKILTRQYYTTICLAAGTRDSEVALKSNQLNHRLRMANNAILFLDPENGIINLSRTSLVSIGQYVNYL